MARGVAETLQKRTEHPVTLQELMLFAPPREGGNGATIFMVQMVLIFAIFYFLLLRPQAKERQRHEQIDRKSVV